MAGKQEMDRRMKAVKDLKQMTRAMQLISQIKLSKAQNLLMAAKPFFVHTIRTMNEIILQAPELFDPLFRLREAPQDRAWRIKIIMVPAEGGMAGSYTLKVLRRAEHLADELMLKRHYNDRDPEITFDVIGQKTDPRLIEDGYLPGEKIERWSPGPDYYMSQEIAFRLLDDYLDGSVDEIYFVYMHMVNQVSSEPLYIRLLPVDPLGLSLLTQKLLSESEIETEEDHIDQLLGRELSFEPNVEEVIKYLEGSYTTALVFGILNEAYASEQSCRMQAMDSATSNAEDLLEDLQQEMNRKRQEEITEELSEIIAGSMEL